MFLLISLYWICQLILEGSWSVQLQWRVLTLLLGLHTLYTCFGELMPLCDEHSLCNSPLYSCWLLLLLTQLYLKFNIVSPAFFSLVLPCWSLCLKWIFFCRQHTIGLGLFKNSVQHSALNNWCILDHWHLKYLLMYLSYYRL